MTDLADLSNGELLAMRDSAPGMQVEMQLRRLDTSYFVFMGNRQDLDKVVTALSDHDSLWLRAVENREKHHTVLCDVVRRLHNLVAAVKTLVDHTRVVLDALDIQGDLKEEYDARVKRDFGSPEHTFVQKLRDYTLHYRFPPIVDTMHWQVGEVPGRGTLDMGIVLDTKQLLDWNNWNKEERQLIATYEDGGVPLGMVVQRYADAVTQFYRWFFGALRAVYHDELENLRAVEDEIARRFPQNGNSR